jgi:hypothetical protein
MTTNMGALPPLNPPSLSSSNLTESKNEKCQRCGKEEVFEILMGMKCYESEFEIKFNEHRFSDRGEQPQDVDRFFSMEPESPFHPKSKMVCDARVAICLACGQAQGKFPATNPFICLSISRGKGEDDNCKCCVCQYDDYDRVEKND